MSAWPSTPPGAPPELVAYAREQFAEVEALLAALTPELTRREARLRAERGDDLDGDGSTHDGSARDV